MKYYIDVLKNFAVFTGRARRSEFWYFFLFNTIFSIVASMIDSRVLGSTFSWNLTGETVSLPYGYVWMCYNLIVLIPGLAVSVRRLHDVGKSGWFILISLIPLIGAIWLLVLYVTDSQIGENKWGPNPKGIGNHDDIEQIGSYLQK